MPDGSIRSGLDAGAEFRPPCNLPAEQGFLGAVLFDNEVYNRASTFLKSEHFYDPVHGRIYDAIGRMIGGNELADAITLAAFANNDPGVRALGGADYLAELMIGRAESGGAVDYARAIYDCALRRELIRVGEDMRAGAAGAVDLTARQLIETAEGQLFSLAEAGSTRKGFVSFADAIASSIKVAAAAFERDGGLSGLATGLDDLDQLLGGLHRSDLIILAGRPSMGKTALATNIAFNIAKRYRAARTDSGQTVAADGGIVAFFSLEMSSEQLATRLLADFSGVPSHLIRRGDIETADFERLRDAAAEMAKFPLYIDDTGGISIAQLSARAQRIKRTAGLDLIVVDYLQLVTASGSKKSDNRVQEVSEVTQGLKALAKQLDVPVLALSQLSRQVENREDKRPQLADLRESGSIEQDADVVMFVYRDEYYVRRREPTSKIGQPEHDAWLAELEQTKGKAEVIVGKQRHGPIDTVQLQFEERLTKFSNLPRAREYNQVRSYGRHDGPAVAAPGR